MIGSGSSSASIPPEKPAITMPPAARHHGKLRGRVCAADEIAHDVDAAPARRLEDAGREVAGAVVERELGAELAAERELLGRPGRRDDARAGGDAELHRRGADAARAGVHEQPLAGRELRALEERELGDVEREEEGRGVRRRRASRARRRSCRRCQRLLGVCAGRPDGAGHHAAAEPRLGARAHGVDHADRLHAERVRKRRIDRAVAAVAAVDLVEVAGGRVRRRRAPGPGPGPARPPRRAAAPRTGGPWRMTRHAFTK